MENPLQLKCLNHISIVCRSVEKSVDFYQNILGFFPVKRPGSFNFSGAWLFNYGIGIHLLQSDNPDSMPKIGGINPKNNHISFQCESMALLEKKLKELNIEYVKSGVEEGGIRVDQLFFHDPNGYMIELCNCDILPVTPLPVDSIQSSCSLTNRNVRRQRQQEQQVQLQVQKIEHVVWRN
ncbi:hypothetical protein Golob_009369 [Gossypium lobatum]|uniref:VOC domain-containing protein n=2 Tax=Gossypium TaxID=3633 RepID=A0A7J8XU54_GOSAI|nr:hypothetical protein [Gossypium lobatum]MBA0690249.1 hypothetical protein [Gossypium aridum]